MAAIQSNARFVAINAAAAGDNTLVAAVTGRRIRIIALVLVAQAAVTATIQSGAGGTPLIGPLALAANAALVLPPADLGWAETAVGALLNLNLSAAATVGGGLVYVEVS